MGKMVRLQERPLMLFMRPRNPFFLSDSDAVSTPSPTNPIRANFGVEDIFRRRAKEGSGDEVWNEYEGAMGRGAMGLSNVAFDEPGTGSEMFRGREGDGEVSPEG